MFLLALAAPAVDAMAATPLPQRLRDTGLYVEGSTTEVRPGILSFSPQYPLWSDGARKRRWLYLPPGSSIDAGRPNAWDFPAGTRLWKEFAFGRRVETRYIERLPDGTWRYAAYVWNEDGQDAVLAPADGIARLERSDAPGGRYAIPSEMDCRACHEGAPVPVLGFSALQLSSDRDPLAPHAEARGRDDVDLRALVERGWLRNLPGPMLARAPRIDAPSPVARAALGYLHGNCAHCHADPLSTSAAVPVQVVLAQDVTDPASAARVTQSLVGAASRFAPRGATAPVRLVVPGDAHSSVLAMRMHSRDPRVQMPPLGTALPDPEGLALVERWINEDVSIRKEPQP